MRIEFWSSVECNAFLSGLIRELRTAGHDAVHRFQVSNSDYRRARSKCGHLWLRIRMYAVYPLQLMVASLWCREPVVSVVTTNTFFAPLLATLVASRQRRVVHLVYDLFPEALIQAQAIRANGFLSKALSWITAVILRRCSANVFLGERLQQYVQSRYRRIRNATVIPVGADGRPFTRHDDGDDSVGRSAPLDIEAAEKSSGPLPVTVLYCGNMGRMHDVATLTELLKAGLDTRLDGFDPSSGGKAEVGAVTGHTCDGPANALAPSECKPARIPTLHFVFHATGSGYSQLRSIYAGVPNDTPTLIAPGLCVTFSGDLGDSEWEATMRAAEIAFVTIAPGAERVVMPSKVYSAMVAGQAILAVCSWDSDLASMVRKHDCGWVVEPGDVGGLAEVLSRIRSNGAEVIAKRRNAYQAGHSCYDVKALVPLWLALFSRGSA